MARSHNAFLRLAIQLARSQAGKRNGRPFGAVIVADGTVIGAAFNRVMLDKDPTAHAEIVALRRASKKVASPDLGGCIMYASCEPCPMCLSAIFWSGIREFYFGCTSKDAKRVGFGDEAAYAEVCATGHGRRIARHQRLSVEALGAMQAWKKQGGVP